MKKLFLILAVSLLVCSCDLTPPLVDREYETKDNTSRFVIVENAASWLVVYDKETLVMYTVSDYGEGRGVFNVLVDADGKPLLWKSKNQTNQK